MSNFSCFHLFIWLVAWLDYFIKYISPTVWRLWSHPSVHAALGMHTITCDDSGFSRAPLFFPLIFLLNCISNLISHPAFMSTNCWPLFSTNCWSIIFNNTLGHKLLHSLIQLNSGRDRCWGSLWELFWPQEDSSWLSLSLVLSGDCTSLWFSLLLLISRNYQIPLICWPLKSPLFSRASLGLNFPTLFPLVHFLEESFLSHWSSDCLSPCAKISELLH